MNKAQPPTTGHTQSSHLGGGTNACSFGYLLGYKKSERSESVTAHTSKSYVKLPFKKWNNRTMKVLTKIVLVAMAVVSFSLTTYAQEILWETLMYRVDTLSQQGRYSNAIRVAEEALKVAENTFGSNHRKVAESLNYLAGLYYHHGKYDQAEPLFRRALEIWEKALGPDHPNVATSLNNLAGLYSAQGKYDHAEPLHKRALEIREKALGPDHPDVATTLENMADLYRKIGKINEAEKLEERAKRIRSIN